MLKGKEDKQNYNVVQGSLVFKKFNNVLNKLDKENYKNMNNANKLCTKNNFNFY